MDRTTSKVGKELILANNIKLSPQGYLSKDSIDIAVKLSIPFASMQTIDDEEEHLQGLRQANALFTYAERTLCTCAQCALCFIAKQNKNILTNPVTNNRVAIC